MSKKDFSGNMKPRKKKATDEEINAFNLEDTKKVKNKLVRFPIRMPEAVYNELNETAERMGVSKKSIVMQGLAAELQRINKK